MTTPEPKTLSEAIPGYPEDHPQRLLDLVNADPDTISDPVALMLRRHTVEAQRAHERHYVRGPEDLLALLRNGYGLHPWESAWTTYGLSADRQVILVDNGKGGVASLRKATRMLPKKDDLPEFPGHAYKGAGRPAWLVIYGGDPSVLDKPHVAQGLATLRRRAPIADICFYVSDPDNGLVPTLWSSTAGFGVSATGGPTGSRVEFPNPDRLEEVMS